MGAIEEGGYRKGLLMGTASLPAVLHRGGGEGPALAPRRCPEHGAGRQPGPGRTHPKQTAAEGAQPCGLPEPTSTPVDAQCHRGHHPKGSGDTTHLGDLVAPTAPACDRPLLCGDSARHPTAGTHPAAGLLLGPPLLPRKRPSDRQVFLHLFFINHVFVCSFTLTLQSCGFFICFFNCFCKINRDK